VLLTGAGFVGERWNGETRARERAPKHDTKPRRRGKVALDGEVTFADLLRAVERSPELRDFLARYSWCAGLVPFHDEALRTAPSTAAEQQDADRLVALELYRVLALRPDGVPSWVDVEGVGAPDQRGVATAYDIGLTPTNQLASLPLRLRPTMEILDERASGAVSLGIVSLGAVPAHYTLLEALAAMYWELSFYGATPARRDAAAQALVTPARDEAHSDRADRGEPRE
jgi:hypothetical protein